MRAPSDGGISSGVPGSTLDTIFDGIDISVPTAPAKVSDPALDAGDFMIDVAPAQPPAPPPTGDGEWASSSALGADLLAAFNSASDPTESEIEVGGGIDISMDAPGLPPPPPGPDPVVHFPPPAPAPTPMPTSLPLVDRLNMLAQRLRAEGRVDDADVVTEAMALIQLQG